MESNPFPEVARPTAQALNLLAEGALRYKESPPAQGGRLADPSHLQHAARAAQLVPHGADIVKLAAEALGGIVAPRVPAEQEGME